MHRYYCTYFDRNYLAKGLSLIESLQRHETHDFTIFVVCLDELTRTLLEKIAPRNVVAVPLHRIEEGDSKLAEARGNRTLVEYYWTLTPSVILSIFDFYPEIDAITYVDGDLFFYSSPEPIYREFERCSVLIHGHRFSPALQHLDVHGTYNVGLLCFRNDARGNEVLGWWRDRCIEWCYARVEDGKFGDQLYLEDWPTRFPGVGVLEHIGAGVAPWNHEQYSYDAGPNGVPRVNGLPLVFYHFHSLAFVIPEIVIPAKDTHYPMREEVVHLCVVPYVESLSRSIATLRSLLPDYSFGLVNNRLLNLDHTFVASNQFRNELRSLKIEHPIVDLGGGWDCYLSPQTVYPEREAIEQQHQRMIRS